MTPHYLNEIRSGCNLNTMAKILIADDSEFMRKMLKDLLVEGGYKAEDIVEAGNGNEALELKEKENPDVIVLDIIMPELDGIGFLEKLNSSEVKKVVVVSAVGQEKMKEKAKALGVKRYIVKPFDKNKEDVLKMVKEVLG